MEQNGNQELSSTSRLCRAGCGFYGAESNEGMCSKCYKDALKRKQAASNSPVPSGRDSPCADSASMRSGVASPALTAVTASLASLGYEEKSVETGTTTVAVPHGSPSTLVIPIQESAGQEDSLPSPASSVAAEEEEGEDKKKPKKTRCRQCKKKVGLTGFTCRCGGVYCGLHRYSDKHECEFDYREMAQQEIRKNNPVIVGEKVQKI